MGTPLSVWDHLEDALAAITNAGVVLPNPGAVDATGQPPYGAWRVDMGERAASLRAQWATENAAGGTITEPNTAGMA